MAGIDAFGTILERGDGAGPEVFTPIANITSLNLPEMQRETYDVTAHDSPNRMREHVGGLVDGGEFTVQLNYDPPIHNVLRADFQDTEPRNYRIVWPAQAGGDRDEFAAFLTGISGEAPHDGKISAELTFKVTGDIEYVAVP